MSSIIVLFFIVSVIILSAVEVQSKDESKSTTLMSAAEDLVGTFKSTTINQDNTFKSTTINQDNTFKSTPINQDNTTLATTQKKQRQSFFNNFNSGNLANLANLANLGNLPSSMGGLRTVMMGGMLYGLSILPAVVLALGGTNLPMSGFLSSLGISKRDIAETSSARLPLLTEIDTRRLLDMLHQAFNQWDVADDNCKQLFVCQMYRQVSTNGITPDLELFREALLHVLDRGGKQRASRAAEDLLHEYEHYFDAARMGMDHVDCEVNFPMCRLSLYRHDEGFQKKSP